MKNTTSEIKNTLEGINKLDKAEHQISDLEDGIEEDTQLEQQQEKGTQKNEDSFRSLWDNIESNNICIIRVSERESKELETYFKK